MSERKHFFDDLAGVAGGAFSALTGLKDEVEATVRARMDEAIRKFDLVRREDMEAVEAMAANARAGQEAAEIRLNALEVRLAALEAMNTRPADPVPPAEPKQSAHSEMPGHSDLPAHHEPPAAT